MGTEKCVFRTICTIAITLGCLVTTPEFAKAITPINSTRLVEAFGEEFCPGCGPNGEDVNLSDGDSVSSASLGIFEESVTGIASFASQASNVSTAGISGTGDIRIGLPPSRLQKAESILLVDFSVLSTRTVNLFGEVSSSEDANDAYVELSNATGALFRIDAADAVAGEITAEFDEEILLQAGVTYTLEAHLSARLFGFDHHADWSVNLSVVPEPSTAILALLSTLGGVSLRRR